METIDGEALPASIRQGYAYVAERADVSFGAWREAMRLGHEAFVESHLAEGREVPTTDRFVDALGRVGVEDAALALELSRVYMGVIREAVRFPEHHPSLLKTLRARARLGLCSNFSHSHTAQEVIDAGGFRQHLDAIVVSDAFGLRKPRREIFESTLAALGVSAGEALHVGDSLRADIGGAVPLGIRTAWVTRRIPDIKHALEDHTGPPPDHTIADLAELPALLDALDR